MTAWIVHTLTVLAGFLLGSVAVKLIGQWRARRDAKRYPDALTRYAEEKVRDAGYGRDALGRPKHER